MFGPYFVLGDHITLILKLLFKLVFDWNKQLSPAANARKLYCTIFHRLYDLQQQDAIEISQDSLCYLDTETRPLEK